jgi:hypothetical protein
MTLPALKGGVSSLDRELLIPRGFILRQLCGGKKFALKLPCEPVSGFLGITPAHSNKFPLQRRTSGLASQFFISLAACCCTCGFLRHRYRKNPD